MIPILAGVSLANGVMSGLLGGSQPTAQPLPPRAAGNFAPFNSFFPASNFSSSFSMPSTGIMTSGQWSQSTMQQLHNQLGGLLGRSLDASDISGKTYHGALMGVIPMNGQLALNIGGQVVGLSQLKQISWSPAL